MITVEEKTDGTQVWLTNEGDYTFVPLSSLRAGDRLEADHRRPQATVLNRADLDDLATMAPNPAEIFVRVRSATPEDRAKPTRLGQGGGRDDGQGPRAGGGR